jgi:GntR family transcriptional repressor for pyruvate dehydrogenase complex
MKNPGHFSPVSAQRASEFVYNKIFSMISEGALNPLDRLPSEQHMMKLFQRSHATIREALGMLEADGYITITPGGGAFVNEITLQPIIRPLVELITYWKVNLREILEFIREAEGAFARNFCAKGTAGGVAELENIQELIKKQIKTGAVSESLVFSFHVYLIKTLVNPVADIIWEAIRLLLAENLSADWLQGLNGAYILKAHKAILKALSEQNEPALEKSLNDFWTKVLESHSVKFPGPGEPLGTTVKPGGDIYAGGSGMTPFTVPKISDIIFNQIKINILNGALKEGDKLPPERDLITSFQCSRPTIREALRKLENNGYISITRGSGSVINKMNSYFLERSLQNVVRLKLVTSDHLQEIRSVCDTITAVRAAENRTPLDLSSIKDILDDTEANLDSRDLNVIYSRAFHARIARAAHNQLLYIISRIIWSVIFDRILAHLKRMDPERAKKIALEDYEEHIKLYEAIKAGDADKAKSMAITHINFVIQQVD